MSDSRSLSNPRIALELAKVHESVFKDVMIYLCATNTLNYKNGVKKLLELIDSYGDVFKMKKHHIMTLSASKEIQEYIEAQTMTELQAFESISGSVQCADVSKKQNRDITRIMVNSFKFTESEAEDKYRVLQEALKTPYVLSKLNEFMGTALRDVFASLTSMVRKQGITAQDALHQVLMELSHFEEDTQAIAAVILSPAMADIINANQTDTYEIIMKVLDDAADANKRIEENRGARCAASECSASIKTAVYEKLMALSFLDKTITDDNMEEFQALIGSISIDDEACNRVPRLLTGFTHFGIAHSLGFFAREHTREITPKNIFSSIFNSMLDALKACPAEQYLTVFALGLLPGIVNSTVLAITGSEMDLPRLGM
jgi:hypothetical protein